jgi:hypothetical protein
MGFVIASYVVAGLLVAGYIWFMVWRLRVDRQKKAAKEAEKLSGEATTAAKLDRILKGGDPGAPAGPGAPAPIATPLPAAQPAAAPEPEPEPEEEEEIQPAVLAAAAAAAAEAPHPQPAGPADSATADPMPAASSNGNAPSVTESLAGIRLPNDLVPLTTLTERPGVGDRVAFWTNRAGADAVGKDFAAELMRLGYAVRWIEGRTLAADRDGYRLIAVVHADADKTMIDAKPAFTSVPEESVVVEVWTQ